MRDRLDELALLRTPVTLHQGDICDLGAYGPEECMRSLQGVTHVFACSVCYDDLILRRIASTLGSRDLCPDFQVLVSLRELPPQQHLVKLGEVRLCCSWNGASPARVYVPADLLLRGADKASLPVLTRLLCDDGVCSLPHVLTHAPNMLPLQQM